MKSTAISILVAGLLIAGAIIFANNSSGGVTIENFSANNVSVVAGKQIVEIRAKGGYQPRISTAKAGIPTVIRFNTSGTFDCSSSVRIPSLGITKFLPQTGALDVELGTLAIGTLKGTCGMGMYPFEIQFQS